MLNRAIYEILQVLSLVYFTEFWIQFLEYMRWNSAVRNKCYFLQVHTVGDNKNHSTCIVGDALLLQGNLNLSFTASPGTWISLEIPQHTAVYALFHVISSSGIVQWNVLTIDRIILWKYLFHVSSWSRNRIRGWRPRKIYKKHLIGAHLFSGPIFTWPGVGACPLRSATACCYLIFTL